MNINPPRTCAKNKHHAMMELEGKGNSPKPKGQGRAKKMFNATATKIAKTVTTNENFQNYALLRVEDFTNWIENGGHDMADMKRLARRNDVRAWNIVRNFFLDMFFEATLPHSADELEVAEVTIMRTFARMQ